MKIGIISYWACPLTRIGVRSGGGMSIYILNLANYLVELGHEVDIYTRTQKEEDENILDLHKKARVIHLKPSANFAISVEKFSEEMKKFIDKNHCRYDLFHAHYYLSGLVGMRMKQYYQIPFFQTFHTLGIAKKKYLNEVNNLRIQTEKNIINEAKCLIVSTELEKSDLVKLYGADKRKIEIVYPGVNHKIFRKISKPLAREKVKLSGSENILLFVGRIDPVKGLGTLIKAVFQLINSHKVSNLQVLLIGGDPHKRTGINKEMVKVKKLINRYKLDDVVKLIGSKPQRLLPYYYNSADIAVLPSVYESFGLVVLEAMACGSAVVASNVGGPKFLIDDGIDGLLFKSNNPESLASCILKLLTDEKLRAKIGVEALKFSQNYCWSKQAKKTAEIYSKYI
jgi:D-inositol-3-phosphate glycosyltransferase